MLFIFDENYSKKIAEAFKILESGNTKSSIPVKVEHITNLVASGSVDEDVVRAAGRHKGIIFTKDKDFRTIRALKSLYRECEVGVTFFKQYKNGISFWDNVKVLVDNWEKIKAVLADDTPPYVYQIDMKGIQRFDF